MSERSRPGHGRGQRAVGRVGRRRQAARLGSYQGSRWYGGPQAECDPRASVVPGRESGCPGWSVVVLRRLVGSEGSETGVDGPSARNADFPRRRERGRTFFFTRLKPAR